MISSLFFLLASIAIVVARSGKLDIVSQHRVTNVGILDESIIELNIIESRKSILRRSGYELPIAILFFSYPSHKIDIGIVVGTTKAGKPWADLVQADKGTGRNMKRLNGGSVALAIEDHEISTTPNGKSLRINLRCYSCFNPFGTPHGKRVVTSVLAGYLRRGLPGSSCPSATRNYRDLKDSVSKRVFFTQLDKGVYCADKNQAPAPKPSLLCAKAPTRPNPSLC